MVMTMKRKLIGDSGGNGFSELGKCYKPAVEPKEMTNTYYRFITIRV
jgi:hypothetical protein